MRVSWHLARADMPPVQEQLNALTIGETPHVDPAALHAPPVPMREQVQHVAVAPPRSVVVEVVLREPAEIHQPEVRERARPLVRDGLAPVVEADPDETASQPWTLGEIRPP